MSPSEASTCLPFMLLCNRSLFRHSHLEAFLGFDQVVFIICGYPGVELHSIHFPGKFTGAVLGIVGCHWRSSFVAHIARFFSNANGSVCSTAPSPGHCRPA